MNKKQLESFLFAERDSNASQRYTKPRNDEAESSSGLVDFIRCVCGCTKFTRSDLESMIFANMDGFMNNPASVKFFRGVCDPDPSSVAQRSLKCYEMCREILYNNLQVDDDEREQLVELCPSYRWEKEFEAAVDSKDDDVLRKFLNDLMTQCKFDIENTNDYHRYKELLRDKCKRLMSPCK
ncbi:uncharacterized protein LOC134833219 [Culicoides brevitarsis]|uniref:uncharacterized protein LOC134833219 n=1 Tax=Culicoides brevitarsis TaxID=469753 RepID=UPI00307BB68F